MRTLYLSLMMLALIPAQSLAQVWGPHVHAVIIVTSAENPTCAPGNVNVAWVIIIRKTDDPTRASRRYVSSLDGCADIRVKALVGTQITISGIMQDRLAIQGLSPSLPTINEQCFNTEAYSVGLTDAGFNEIDPNDLSNIINAQGYGLFWDITDMFTEEPMTFVVTGCAGGRCPQANTIFNTDTGTQPNTCPVLAPIL